MIQSNAIQCYTIYIYIYVSAIQYMCSTLFKACGLFLQNVNYETGACSILQANNFKGNVVSFGLLIH